MAHELVLAEWRQVLAEKFRVQPALLKKLEAEFRTSCEVLNQKPVSKARVRDKKDDPILQAALDGHCDWMISGDKDLTSLKKVEGMPISSPRDFLETLGVEEPYV